MRKQTNFSIFFETFPSRLCHYCLPSTSNAGAIKCCKERKITLLSNKCHNIPLFPRSTDKKSIQM